MNYKKSDPSKIIPSIEFFEYSCEPENRVDPYVFDANDFTLSLFNLP